MKYNNYMNKKENNSNNFVAKKIKSGNPQSKVRKRNENKWIVFFGGEIKTI